MVHKVDTGASVLARLILALIYFILTVDALIPWDALTGTSTREETLEHCWKQSTRADEVSRAAIHLGSLRPYPALTCFSGTVTRPTSHAVHGQLAVYPKLHLPAKKPPCGKD